MKKILVVLLLLCSFTAVFAGGQQDAADSAEVFAIDPPAEPTDINVMGWTFPINDYYRSEFEKLDSIENLSVNIQFLDNAGAQEQVRLALSGGKKSPYEIVHGANSQISEWGFAGWLEPLDSLVEKYWDEYDLGDIPANAWDAAKVNGKIMGIPVIANTFQLIYRSDLFEKHGIDVPETYADVIAAAQKLKADESSIDLPFVINLHAGWAWEIEFFQMLGGFGGKYLNDDNTPAFNGPEGVKAMELLLEVADKAVGEEGMAYSVDEVEIGIQTGRLAFANTWASRATKMNNPEVSDFADVIKFAPSPSTVPGGPYGAGSWNDFYCIPATTDVDKELIFKVIMETVDLESQKGAVEFGLPTRMKTLESENVGAYMAADMASLSKGVGAYPNIPVMSLLIPVLREVLPLAKTGEYSVQEVLDMAAENYTGQAKANGFID